ncbi:MAG: hypothetical protein WBG88_06810 [Mesorhizobium sp.]
MTDFSEFTSHLPALARAPESPAAAAYAGNLDALIGRIGEAVEEETAAIRANPRFDLKASNARKSRCLYELNRAMKGMGQVEFAERHRDGLVSLQEKLSRNEQAILAHLSAVTEVANLLKNAIQQAEADGTYSAGEFGWAQP